jgi:zinc protease
MISNSKEIISNRYSEPKNVFADTVNAVLGNYNYRRTGPTLEKLQQVDLEKMYRVYQDRFGDASGFTFIFVGSFSIDSITPLLEKYLGGLPSLNKKETARDLGIHIPKGKLIKKVYKGSENKATVKMVFSGNYNFSAETNMQLAAVKEVLQIKITQHLREDESEVYSPSVQVGFSKYPAATYAFTVNFGCAPKNADHLVDLVEKEIKNLQEKGPVAEDIEKFKAEYNRVHELQLRSNEYWLSYLDNQLENNEDMLLVTDYSKRLEKVNQLSVQEAAKKYLSGKNEIKFELLPEK